MSGDEWCSNSNHYAPHQRPGARREPLHNFDHCPECKRRLRLTWNGKFYRHKRVLGGAK